jgi:quercetin dioxygenase-like cupin family protein
MDEATFRAEMAQRGHAEGCLVELEALRFNPQHQHTYFARGLVLQGEFHIETPAWGRCFTPGEIFEVPPGTPHTEKAGSSGVRLLAYRIQPG